MMKIPHEEVGRALAHANDEQQGALFNEFGRQLKLVCNDRELAGSMQLCAMAQQLDRHGVELVKTLAAYIDLEETDAAKVPK
jgi:hypothetical protein